MSEPERRCRKCEAVIPAGASTCPACHHVLDLASAPTLASSAPSGRWLIFFLVLLAPAIVTLATGSVKDFWPAPTFIGSGIAAIYCGVWLARRYCQTTVPRLLVGMVFCGLFFVVSFALCCAGCTLAGVELNIH